MNSGLLVVVALFLIYLAVTGKYGCVTAAAKCLFQNAKLCECGAAGAAQRQVDPAKGPDLIQQGRDLYDKLKGVIRGK